MSYPLFRRQFLLADAPLAPGPDWRHRRLADGRVLSFQADLAVAEIPGTDGPALRLGIACGGSGRFARLDGPWLRNDGAGALMGLFHGRDAEGRPVAGSTPSLVALALGRDPAAVDLAEPLRHHAGINYLPVPGTRHHGIRRLLRDQRLDLDSGRVERDPAPIAPLASPAAAVETLGDELRRFARELRAAVEGTVFLQLTAGLDSRTILAAFVAEGIAFETVTLRSKVKPEADVRIAALLSRRLGVRHHVVGLERRPDPAAGLAYRVQTAGGTNDWNLTDLFPGQAYRYLGAGDAMVGGLCFGIGRQKLEALAGLDLATATGAEIWRRVGREPGPPVFHRFLDEWLDWRRQDPYPLDLAATYYLDQRIPGWVATMLSGFDLLPGLTLHPANNPRIYAALLTPDPAAQHDGRLQHATIAALAPGLAGPPINPVSPGRRLRALAAAPRRTLRRSIRALRPGRSPAT